jgi:hypothetical protein
MNSDQLRTYYSNRAKQHTFNTLDVHEREKHQGQPCLNNRINFIAWLCHCIGIKPKDLAQVSIELEIYDRECRDKDCGHDILEAEFLGRD